MLEFVIGTFIGVIVGGLAIGAAASGKIADLDFEYAVLQDKHMKMKKEYAAYIQGAEQAGQHD